MSWTSYIDNLKAQGVQECGIFGHDGSTWAVSGGMKATQAEIASVVGGINGGSFPSGVMIGGLKYQMLNCDQGNSVTAKCSKAPSDDQKYLGYAALGKTFVMIGLQCGANERNVSAAVEKLKDYLAGSGY